MTSKLTAQFGPIACLFLSGCVTFAPPSPLVTFGGPTTTPRDTSEIGVAVGAGAAAFDGAQSSGNGLFVRYRHGVGEQLDLGVDALYAHYSDKGAFTVKGALRRQLDPHWRLELGLGAADSSDGKSLNTDLGITCGTRRADSNWNYYVTLRGGWSRGYAGDATSRESDGGDDPQVPPPDSAFALVALGAQTHIGPEQRFILEVGVGDVHPNGHDDGLLVYFSAGVLFDVK
jgi:hypothetical protein